MGELHLEVIIHRLEREFHAHVRAGRPQVVYRETIAAPPAWRRPGFSTGSWPAGAISPK